MNRAAGQVSLRRVFGLLILMAIVTLLLPAYGSPELARAHRVKSDLLVLEDALDLFRRDVGRYPTTQEGLAVLVRPASELKTFNVYPAKAYLGRISRDPWGNEYHYVAPGSRSGLGYDLWTDGADGKPGGDGVDADVGNWPGSLDRYIEREERSAQIELLRFSTWAGVVLGTAVGLPFLTAHAIYRRLKGGTGLRTLLQSIFAQFGRLVAACVLLSIFMLGFLVNFM
jgi:general secretion pathway protein G